MLDWTQTIGRSSEIESGSPLGDRAWSGSFKDYLVSVLSDPRLLGRSVERLSDLLKDGDPPADGDLPAERGGEPSSVETESRVPPEIAGRLRRALHTTTLGADVGDPRVVIVESGGAGVGPWADALSGAAEAFSRSPCGARFTLQWFLGSPPAEDADSTAGDDTGTSDEEASDEEASKGEASLVACPWDEEPFRLIPSESRRRVLSDVQASEGDERPVTVDGPLCPTCSALEARLLRRYHGDWSRMIQHVRVRRLVFSADARRGVVRLECDALVETPVGPGELTEIAEGAARSILVLDGSGPAVAKVLGRLLDWADGLPGNAEPPAEAGEAGATPLGEGEPTPQPASRRDFVIVCDSGAIDDALERRLGRRRIPVGP